MSPQCCFFARPKIVSSDQGKMSTSAQLFRMTSGVNTRRALRLSSTKIGPISRFSPMTVAVLSMRRFASDRFKQANAVASNGCKKWLQCG